VKDLGLFISIGIKEEEESERFIELLGGLEFFRKVIFLACVNVL